MKLKLKRSKDTIKKYAEQEKGQRMKQKLKNSKDNIISVRPIYRLADISVDIFGRYGYIGIGKLDIDIGHIGIGIGIG